MKLSSIVLSSQRVPNTEKKTVNPLVRDGVEWIPNVPHVFRQDQHLYFLYEVYDPAKQKGAAAPASFARVDAAGSGRGARADQHRVPERRGEGV